MSTFKTIPHESALTEAELDRLEAFLKSKQEKDPEVMSLEELDGFLVAIVVGPEIVMPSEYLEELFGEEDPFATEEEAEEILELIFRHHNVIATSLEKDEPYMPVFTEIEENVPRGNLWAHGFLRGSLFSHDAWSELMKSEEYGDFLLPMLILENEHNPDPELRPPPITEEKREDLLVSMAVAALIAYRHFQPQREEAAEAMSREGDGSDYYEDEIPLSLKRTEPKVGRNDPCPCGSGKKYKKCHGNVTAQ